LILERIGSPFAGFVPYEEKRGISGKMKDFDSAKKSRAANFGGRHPTRDKRSRGNTHLRKRQTPNFKLQTGMPGLPFPE
jgi:hypothetical protein